MSTNRICIVLEGGVVQAVIADQPIELEVLVVEYDDDGDVQVRQENGSLEPAFVDRVSVGQAGIDLADIVAQLENRS